MSLTECGNVFLHGKESFIEV